MEIKETKEVLRAVLMLGALVAKEAKDGVDIKDAAAIFGALLADPVKKKLIEDALAGVSAVPAEVKDLSLLEAVELGKVVIEEVPNILAALK